MSYRRLLTHFGIDTAAGPIVLACALSCGTSGDSDPHDASAPQFDVAPDVSTSEDSGDASFFDQTPADARRRPNLVRRNGGARRMVGVQTAGVADQAGARLCANVRGRSPARCDAARSGGGSRPPLLDDHGRRMNVVARTPDLCVRRLALRPQHGVARIGGDLVNHASYRRETNSRPASCRSLARPGGAGSPNRRTTKERPSARTRCADRRRARLRCCSDRRV